MEKEYYLGLDMGTNSVGWAVTDDAYNLIRFKGKDMWGIREFDEANPAVERRNHRTSRRREQRNAVRMGLIRSYFADEIQKVDSNFYQRLDNSFFHVEDKQDNVKDKNGIFNDKNYKDADYYKQYPTIFHLRKELIEDASQKDVRLVYLAVANMFKHRGHFLLSGIGSESSKQTITDLYNQVSGLITEEYGISLKTDIAGTDFEQVLCSREYSRTRKSEKVCEILEIKNSDKLKKAFVKSMCGLSVKITDIIDDTFTEISDEDKKITFSFVDSDYDEKAGVLEEKLGTDVYDIISKLKEIHDKAQVAEIMKNYQYLSFARVADYEKHKKDLKILKRVVKKHFEPTVYDKLFRSEENGTYSAYVNSFNSEEKSRRNYKERKQEDLYNSIKKLLKSVDNVDDTDIEYIKNEMDKENFLPKQLTFKNGVIPNQIHASELKAILKNAEKYLPFLNEKDESGYTVSERILKLFSFQIPYYVGPVSSNSNGWVKRLESGQVLPWNIDKKIDLKETSEQFIQRMVRNCTYIAGEKVLPKASLLYENFKVLNEINNLSINDERITVNLKQDLYNTLFLKGKRVTRKQIFNYFHSRGLVEEDSQISGIDIAVNNSLSTYGKFLPLFGEHLKEDKYKKMVDDIVFWCTVYGDSRKFLREQLEEKYSDVLDENQIKRITGMKFKDWGNLSKEFLELSGCCKSTGEMIPLIRAMWETNYNLMELLHSEEFTYSEELEEKQGKIEKVLSEYTIDDLNEEYFSAPVKRMVWQTLLIIKEIEKIMKCPPTRIFVEMTRKDDEKGDNGRKSSRKDQLLALYKKIQSEDKEWKKEMSSRIEDYDKNGALRSKKLYLYFIQKGLDMYTGKPIDLDNLMSANSNYDIDHIYPRHFVKDDNINNNLVLASKPANAEKSDIYPIKDSIYQKMKYTWKVLRDEGLITEEKYKRLTGRNPFTDEQKAGFIARQLVETGQGTKGVADLLTALLPDTKLVYSKAGNVSDFRKRYDIPKSRLINDFHHAHDAYLNIVVGNIYFTKFTSNPLNYIRKECSSKDNKYQYNLGNMYKWDVKRDGKTAWIAAKEGETGTIATVKKILSRNTPTLTRLTIEGHGGIADATLYSHKKAKQDAYIPLKSSDARMADVTKYGGYSSVTTAYLFLVEHEIKGKKIRTLETVPLYLKDRLENSKEKLEEYCRETLGYTNPSVRMKKIKLQSLIKLNGYYMQISGRTGNRFTLRNYVQLCLNGKWVDYIHKLEKYQDKGFIDNVITDEKNVELYNVLCEKHSVGIFTLRPNPVGDKIKKGYDKFVNLTTEEQIKLLIEIIKLTCVGIVSANLTLIGGASISGKMLISKNITDAKECLLINQSVTGLYENRIDLLRV